MPELVEQPIISTIQIRLLPNQKAAFSKWQAKLNEKIIAFPGFISLEFLSEQNDRWVIVKRFASLENSSAWYDSEGYKELKKELEKLTLPKGIEEKGTTSILQGGITQVIIAEVHQDKVEAYKAWSAKIHNVEAKFPGFRGVYIQSPQESQGTNWITLLQFDTLANLDNWLNSPERHDLLKESASLIASLESHRVISPYAGWFASIAKVGELPPVWKQTMIVLLVLFPIVMLELKYLSPLMQNLNLSLATFIGNAISVTLISFPMMPIALYLLGWWLTPRHSQRVMISLIGTLVLLLLYIVEIAIFWNFLF